MAMYEWFKGSWNTQSGLIQWTFFLHWIKSIKTKKFYFCRSTLKQKCPVGYAGRTDARVHALSTYFEFDYKSKDDQPLDTQQLLGTFNTKLMHMNMAIRINSIEVVDKNIFEAHRNIRRRCYLYRIAVRKPIDGCSNDAIFPIEEVDRCFFIEWDTFVIFHWKTIFIAKCVQFLYTSRTISCCSSPMFDIDRVTEAAGMFLGKHDFRSFMKWSPEAKTVNIIEWRWHGFIPIIICGKL